MITTGGFTGSFSWGRAVAIAPPPPSGMTLIYDTTLSPTTEIQLPLRGTVNVLVDWGDGNTETVNTVGDKSHTYATSGTYTVTITGTLAHFGLDNWYDSIVNPESLTAVTSWDGLGLISLSSAFKGTENLATVPATLPATVTDLSYLFNRSWYFNDPNVSSWDVSNVTNFEGTFLNTDVFDQPLNSWNVSNAVTMELMFCAALSFNQPLDNWNVSNVTNMSDMFGSAEKFNQNIDNWNVSNVTNMYSMFAYAYDFNQPLNSWDVSNVTDMTGLFTGTKAFNQPLDNWIINPANTNFAYMFAYTEAFNNTINTWNVSNVTSMYSMFDSADAFNQPLNNWNVSNVTDMSGMFRDATAFNQSLNLWTTSSLVSAPGMFWGATVYNQPMCNWDVSNITSTYMNNMFRNASSFNQNLTAWCVSAIPFQPSNFSTGSPLTAPNKPIWGTCPVPMTLVYDTSLSATTEIQLPLNGTVNVEVYWGDGNCESFNTSGNKSHTFATNGIYTVKIYGSLTHFGTDDLVFTSVVNPESLISVVSWGNLGLTSLYSAFKYCLNLTSVPSTLPSTVTTLAYTFHRCETFNQNISTWDITNVTSLEGTFLSAKLFNQPLNTWNTSNVTTMELLFDDAIMFNQPLNNWDVSNVTNMRDMFGYAETFDQNIGNWDVSSVTDMTAMFNGAFVFNQNISNWCVTLIPSEPTQFSLNSPLTAPNKPVWGTCPGAPDPYFASVRSLIHFDDTPGTTIPADQKSFFTWENSNTSNAFVSSAITKYGSGSLSRPQLVSPGGLYTTAPAGTYSPLFTIEFYVYFTNITSFPQYTRFLRHDLFYVNVSGPAASFTFESFSVGYPVTQVLQVSAVQNQWYFVAITGDGSVAKLYVDGVHVSTFGANAKLNENSILGLSNGIGGNGDFQTMYFDEFRYTDGVVRYSGNFTPPTAPFPNY